MGISVIPRIFGVLQRTDRRLSGEAMLNGVAAGTPFASFGNRTSAFASIAPVGFDLPERRH
jgi:hypothetical protein